MMDRIEIWVCRWLIRRLRIGYGANCTTRDTTDYPEHPRALNAQGRCASCQAAEVIEWLEGHIELCEPESAYMQS